MRSRICLSCATRYKPNHAIQRFCSKKCAAVSRIGVTPTRACVNCGGQFKRRRGERRGAFIRRKTCSHECAVALTHKAQRRETGDKKCRNCGAGFNRKISETRQQFLRRRACSRKCRSALIANAHRMKSDKMRHCLACGRAFGQRRSDGERYFLRRLTCGRRSCWSSAAKKKGGKKNIVAFGIYLSLADAEQLSGLSKGTVHSRLRKREMDPENALTMPVRRWARS